MISTPIYSLRVPEVYRALETTPKGLTEEEVAERLSLYGANILSEPPEPPWWQRMIFQFIHPMAVLLWVSGILAILVNELVLGLVIWAVVFVNASFSFWREHRASQAVQALKNLLPTYARVLRNGEEVQVPSSEIVPGDILILAEGDNISADARVVEEYGLRTNNSTITGEALPARRTADPSIREGLSELERPNLVFAGTSVVSGTAKAVVYATGMLTQFGRIANLTQSVPERPSPLQTEIRRLTRRVSIIAFGFAIIIFVVGAFDTQSLVFGEEKRLIKSFIFALGVLVAAIPEGLPATLTLSLAMAVQRLAQRGVLVKKLAMVETLGNISVICTDKSGTLTQNQMTVREIWVGGSRLKVGGVGYEPKGNITPEPKSEEMRASLRLLLEAAQACNNSRLNPPHEGHPLWSALGDQTEAALRVVARKGGIHEEHVHKHYPRIHELPFDARRKRMTTIHRTPTHDIAFVKGAPREILQICTHWQNGNEVLPLDDKTRSEILKTNDDYARNALRVLAFAYRTLPPRSRSFTEEMVERDLTFLGLAAMMDPPRPEVTHAIETCTNAGIRWVMVTGDYGLTAETVARRIGMLRTENPRIITGADLEQLSDFQLQQLLKQEIIFARMAPEHKLRLVAAFQALGEVVAVTGDGVNDAPALRKADVGVVMGVVGTDVAREAADIILTNDNFSTIVNAIEEGRAVYDNIRKFITYIFSSNVPELLPFLMSAMTRIPLALTVRQILAIDMGTDLLPALALGVEKPEPDVMQRPPRPRGKPIIDRNLLGRAVFWLGLIEAILCYVGFFLVYGGVGNIPVWKVSLARLNEIPHLLHEAPKEVYLLAVTVFHAGVVMAQIGNLFACRSERLRLRQVGLFTNPLVFVGIIAEIAIIFSLIYIPFLAVIFEHRPLPLWYWPLLFLYAPILYALDRFRKQFVRWWRSLREVE
ncbi:MAG: cation-translocating P-type ATPase [Anaerolineales bacterium]